MTAKEKKIIEFLERVADVQNPSAEERGCATELLIETLQQRNKSLKKHNRELDSSIERLRTIRKRLEYINAQMKLSQKTYTTSDTIH